MLCRLLSLLPVISIFVQDITSQLNDATNTGGTFTWSSDNTSVATVDATGLVSGVSPGTATISYAFTDGNGCTTTVTADVVVTTTPTVAPITTTAPSGFNVCIGGTIQLKDATPSGIWSSSDPLIADVNFCRCGYRICCRN